MHGITDKDISDNDIADNGITDIDTADRNIADNDIPVNDFTDTYIADNGIADKCIPDNCCAVLIRCIGMWAYAESQRISLGSIPDNYINCPILRQLHTYRNDSGNCSFNLDCINA